MHSQSYAKWGGPLIKRLMGRWSGDLGNEDFEEERGSVLGVRAVKGKRAKISVLERGGDSVKEKSKVLSARTERVFGERE